MQVQGSSQVEFPDGSRARLAYDGRNGLPYTSIGKILIEAGEIAERDMSLASLKAWLRRDRAWGLDVMRRNRSFVFFQLVEDFDPDVGPVAGAGVAPHAAAINRDRPNAVGLWPAVLDRRRIAVGGRDASPVPPPDGRPGHPARRLWGRRAPTSSSAAATRRERAPAPFAIRRPRSSCFCREGTSREGHAAPLATFAALER